MEEVPKHHLALILCKPIAIEWAGINIQGLECNWPGLCMMHLDGASHASAPVALAGILRRAAALNARSRVRLTTPLLGRLPTCLLEQPVWLCVCVRER